MSNTLERLKAQARQIQQDSEVARMRAEAMRDARAAAAAPLVQAYEDVKHQLVRVPVLRHVWGEHFENHDEHLAGLLIEMLETEGAVCGLKLRVAGGTVAFLVDAGNGDDLAFLSVRETQGLTPTIRSFVDQEHWMDYFIKVLADMIEV